MRHSTINFESLKYLVVSADAGKLARAAKELGIETASLSRRVQRVEDELGLTVFERGHDGLKVTRGGAAVLSHARRVLADFRALREAGSVSALGESGELRLGVRLALVGEPVSGMLAAWHSRFPNVDLRVHELDDRELMIGIESRRLDLAFMTKHTIWPRAVAEPLYREALLVALPVRHRFARRPSLKWETLREETFLVQGWGENQIAREYYSSFFGSGIRYETHGASKQSILGLVAAGFGLTLVTQAQSEVKVPGVLFRSIDEPNANLEIQIVWVPENEDAVVGRFVSFMKEIAKAGPK